MAKQNDPEKLRATIRACYKKLDECREALVHRSNRRLAVEVSHLIHHCKTEVGDDEQPEETTDT